MPDFLRHVFASDGFMPHGHCYLWRPGLVWLHVVSDVLIGVAYVTISATLANLVSRIRNIPFNWIFLAFGLSSSRAAGRTSWRCGRSGRPPTGSPAT